MMTRTMYQHFW